MPASQMTDNETPKRETSLNKACSEKDIYRPLPHPQHFRLLLLQPGNKFDDDVHISLLTCHIDQAPSYRALSYAWGDEEHMKTVFIDEKPLKVTYNLFIALLRLRQKTTSTTLWVDAICINQKDKESEKTQQVQQMRKIYANAEMTLVWLGEKDEDTKTVFEVLEYLADEWEQHQRDSGFWPRDTKVVDRNEDALRSFLWKRPYFQRIWVVQEIAVARFVVVTCGYFSMPFERFFHACSWLHRYVPRELEAKYPKMPLRFGKWRDEFQHDRRGFGRRRFVDLLWGTRNLSATDPRDKVFALLGIADSRGIGHLTTDYSKSIKDVYASVARSIIVDCRHLHILSCVQNHQNTLGLPSLDLPSWVADWRQKWARGSLGSLPSNFRASGKNEAVMHDVGNPEILSLGGLKLDHIEHVFEINDAMYSSHLDRVYLNENVILDLVHRLGFRGCYPFTNERYPVSIFSTLTAGSSPLSKYLKARYKSKTYPQFAGWSTSDLFKSELPTELWEIIASAAAGLIRGRKLFVTEQGYLGLGYPHVEVGDFVCILLGGNFPYVLRKEHGKNDFRFIGDCYVHGVMEGEALERSTKDDFRNFVIV